MWSARRLLSKPAPFLSPSLFTVASRRALLSCADDGEDGRSVPRGNAPPAGLGGRALVRRRPPLPDGRRPDALRRRALATERAQRDRGAVRGGDLRAGVRAPARARREPGRWVGMLRLPRGD